MAIPILRLNIDDNPKIIVKQDTQPVIVTKSYNFVGSGATSITETQVGNTVEVMIYSTITGGTLWGGIIGDINTQTDLITYVSQSINAATSGLTSSWNDLEDKPQWLSGTTLSAFQTGHTHDYNNLDNLPTLFDGNYNNLSNLPVLFSGSYSDLTDKPDLNIYLTGVTWNDIQNKPELWTSGQTVTYINSQGFITSLNGYWTSAQTTSYVTGLGYITGLTWTELQDKPTLFSGSYDDLTGKPVLFDGNYNSLSNLPSLFSGSYNDLSNKPDLSVYQPVSGMSIYLTGVTWDSVADKPELVIQSDFNTHTGNTDIHYMMSGITIGQTQVLNLDTDLDYIQSQIDILSVTETSDRKYILESGICPITGYELMRSNITTLSAVTKTVDLNNNTLLIQEWASCMPLEVTSIRGGLWALRFRASASSVVGGRITTLHYEAYRRDTGGTEYLLFTSTPKEITSTSTQTYLKEEILPEFTGFTATDLLVLKVYATSNNVTTVNFHYGDTVNSAYLEVPIAIATAPLWTNIEGKPVFLDYTTIGDFQTGHTHSYNNLDDKPTLFDGDYNSLSNKPDLSVYQPVSGMSVYLTGVTWNDVTDKPTLFSGSYNDLSDKPTLFTGHTFVASGNTQIAIDGNQVTIYSSASGGTGGSENLSGLTDVTITAPVNNDVLKYSGGTWYNETPVDVFANVADGQYFLRSGDTIVGGTGSEGGVSTAVFNSYTGVTDSILTNKSAKTAEFIYINDNLDYYVNLIDSNKIIEIDNTGETTIFLDNGLTDGLQFTVVNVNPTGTILFSAYNFTTLRSKENKVNLNSQYGAVSCYYKATGAVWTLIGDLA